MATHATALGSSAWAPANRPQATLWAVLALATLLACLGVAWWGETPLARWLSREAAAAAWPRHLLFVLDWTLMCAAMMLPTALPLLSSLARVCSRQRHSGRLSLACAVAFVAVWAVSGIAVRAVHDAGAACFLDLKLHDIPATMAKATASAARLGVRFLTVHGVAGPSALRAVTADTTLESATQDGADASAPRDVLEIDKHANLPGFADASIVWPMCTSRSTASTCASSREAAPPAVSPGAWPVVGSGVPVPSVRPPVAGGGVVPHEREAVRGERLDATALGVPRGPADSGEKPGPRRSGRTGSSSRRPWRTGRAGG